MLIPNIYGVPGVESYNKKNNLHNLKKSASKLPLDVFKRVLFQIKLQVVSKKVFVKAIVSIWPDRFCRAAVCVEDGFDFAVACPNCREFADFAVDGFEID